MRPRDTELKLVRAAARVRADLALGSIDAMLTAGAYLIVLILRFDGVVPVPFWRVFQTFVPIALVVHLVANVAWGLYRQMWRHASVAEARRVVLAGFTALLVLEIVSVFDSSNTRMPHSVLILGALVTICLIGAIRFQSRLFALHRSTRDRNGLRVVIIGAGEAGGRIVREMRRDPGCGLEPVALVDDDPRKLGRSLAGVPVVGKVGDLVAVVERHGAHQVVLAIPSAEPDLVRQAVRNTEAAQVTLKVLPAVAELLGGQPTVRDVRDLQIEDLLGRNQVATDLDAVHRLLTGKRVLITGAGGSIGSEIARQVSQCAPGELVLVDHDETHLHDAEALLELEVVTVLADIRDGARVREVFRSHRPEVVFHAAAHKHVPVLERFPCEAVQTNVGGTANVMAAASAMGTQHLVFISTDKAVRPSSVMGATKWVGEQMLLQTAPPDHPWCAVRFGNVIGSRGSVIPTFTRQILTGGPLTVTDRRMTRFFMSVQEAVQLVLQAAVLSRGGEVFMLDMGQPVNIYELAERMIRLSGRDQSTDLRIDITGVRQGEKLVEELRTADEEPQPTDHQAIVRLYPAHLSGVELAGAIAELAELANQGRGAEVARLLFELNARSVDRATLGDERVIDLTDGEQCPDRTISVADPVTPS